MSKVEAVRILIVDDEPVVASFIANLLKAEYPQVDTAHSLGEAVQLLEGNSYALVLCDVRLDHEDGTAILPHMKRLQPGCATVFVTGFGTMDNAVKAIHEGAFDYISKPIDLSEMEADLRAVTARVLKQHQVLNSSVSPGITLGRGSSERTMVGKAPAMIGVYRALARASLNRENVLINGESGTGKELVATAIHEKSPWANKPFVTVNCCALAENLLESELFGHVRGAFTGAVQAKQGLFEEANGGTLFLDEIGDISLSLQVKLLRAVQEGEIKAVGSSEVRKVDVRIITATHRDLPQLVQQGKFREDLFYRLKVISIEMPPLRDRMEDLPDLVRHFALRSGRKSLKKLTGVSDEAMEILKQYSWPGNIRELENAIGRAAAMANSPILFPEDFPPEIAAGNVLSRELDSHSGKPEGSLEVSARTSAAVGALQPLPVEVGESLESLERRHIARTLQSVNFNKSKAADILGIDRVTLYRKAFKYGLIQKGGAKKESGSAQ